ncbi:hypothetical protein HaLaN_32771 [Haematococcus lacustris]|uniref:Uncharacterized protein n=1 Tax=Haematococcus lacustris TaxID=44745 RepID=A0A6A0AM55_HAELA|nr:hypothetical protein HaLaN_32771 [Haematococcus lacustris]
MTALPDDKHQTAKTASDGGGKACKRSPPPPLLPVPVRQPGQSYNQHMYEFVKWVDAYYGDKLHKSVAGIEPKNMPGPSPPLQVPPLKVTPVGKLAK